MADSGLSALYINLFHSCGNLMRGCPSVCSHYRWGNWDREWKIMYSVLSTCECWSCDWHGGSLTSEFTPPNPSPVLPPGTSFLEHPSHWLPRFFSSFSNQASLCRPRLLFLSQSVLPRALWSSAQACFSCWALSPGNLFRPQVSDHQSGASDIQMCLQGSFCFPRLQAQTFSCLLDISTWTSLGPLFSTWKRLSVSSFPWMDFSYVCHVSLGSPCMLENEPSLTSLFSSSLSNHHVWET